jgi:hypothetical protein
MKKIFISITLILSLASVFAQRAEEKEFKTLMKDLGYSWSETKSVALSEGESEYYWRSFFTGNEYAILTFSEESEVQDVDLYLYDDAGSLLKQSTSNGNFEIIEYSPLASIQVKVVIKNYDSTLESTKFKCKFMIFYK